MQNEYRAKRSAAIFLATYVTGVETRGERTGGIGMAGGREGGGWGEAAGKGGSGKRGKKASREFPSIATTTTVPDGGTPDYSQGIFQLSKSLRRFLLLKRVIRK